MKPSSPRHRNRQGHRGVFTFSPHSWYWPPRRRPAAGRLPAAPAPTLRRCLFAFMAAIAPMVAVAVYYHLTAGDPGFYDVPEVGDTRYNHTGNGVNPGTPADLYATSKFASIAWAMNDEQHLRISRSPA